MIRLTSKAYNEVLLARDVELRAKLLAKPGSRHFVLADILAKDAGVDVSPVTIRRWSRADQGAAYLWARGVALFAPLCLERAIAAGLYARLRQAHMRVHPEDLAQWSAAQKRDAFTWANAFLRGREDLPPPAHVEAADRAFAPSPNW